MHLIQLFIPVGSKNAAGSEDIVTTVQRELTERHGGATAYVNSPAKGLWSGGGRSEEDIVVTIEVMVDAIDREWWRRYRDRLEKLLSQDELLVRSLPIEKL